jgi:cytochrome c553
MIVRVLFAIFMAAVAAAAFGQEAPEERDRRQQEEEERTAEKFITGVCSTCHDADLIRGTKATRQEWLDIVKNMNGKGAGLSDQDVELLANYLARKSSSK